jgi:membrane glycosyltransferase
MPPTTVSRIKSLMLAQLSGGQYLLGQAWLGVGAYQFGTLPDGEPYPGGAVYELIRALAAKRRNELPDILVYRKTARIWNAYAILQLRIEPMLIFEDRTHAPPNELYTLTPLWSRRALFASIVGISVLGSAIILYLILAPIKIGPVAVLMIVALAVNETWVATIFWNAIVGFLILHLFRRPIFHSWPELAKIPSSTPLTTRTAVVMVVCNEEASASFSRLKAIKRSLDQTEAATSFDYFVLSDSSERAAITNERIWYTACYLPPARVKLGT